MVLLHTLIIFFFYFVSLVTHQFWLFVLCNALLVVVWWKPFLRMITDEN
jgi:hypothetical protein